MTGDGTDAAGLGADLMQISVGPHHPSTHGVLRMKLTVSGETVVRAEPEHGFLHTGIEKTAEHLTWTQAITVLDRMNYLTPHITNLCYALAVEKLLDIRAPAKAEAVRVIMAELQRIASHLVVTGNGLLDLGVTTQFFWACDLREGIFDIFEEATGARIHHCYFRPGGLAKDLPGGFDRVMTAWLSTFPGRFRELMDMTVDNPVFLDRTRGVGVLTAGQAMGLGLTGPNLRACGVDYDVRKAYPYSGYEHYNWDTVVGKSGDCHQRFIMRFLEVLQSVRIIRQAWEGLPEGPHCLAAPRIVPPLKVEARSNIEALIHHFKLHQSGFTVPPGEIYQPVESARGELGLYIVSAGHNKPFRLRVRPPSFYDVHALPAIVESGLISDMVAAIASVDPVFGEVDR